MGTRRSFLAGAGAGLIVAVFREDALARAAMLISETSAHAARLFLQRRR